MGVSTLEDVLTEAVAETRSLDHDKLADYLHKAKFNTVAGNFSFAQDGEWSQTRQVWTQFQNVQPNNLDQFRDGKVQPIVWPIESKSGEGTSIFVRYPGKNSGGGEP